MSFLLQDFPATTYMLRTHPQLDKMYAILPEGQRRPRLGKKREDTRFRNRQARKKKSNHRKKFNR